MQNMKNDIIDTTVVYLKKDDNYLLLYRNKKKNDINHAKWIAVG
jgi:8-oxo-dGTP diphosphatase